MALGEFETKRTEKMAAAPRNSFTPGTGLLFSSEQ